MTAADMYEAKTMAVAAGETPLGLMLVTLIDEVEDLRTCNAEGAAAEVTLRRALADATRGCCLATYRAAGGMTDGRSCPYHERAAPSSPSLPNPAAPTEPCPSCATESSARRRAERLAEKWEADALGWARSGSEAYLRGDHPLAEQHRVAGFMCSEHARDLRALAAPGEPQPVDLTSKASVPCVPAPTKDKATGCDQSVREEE